MPQKNKMLIMIPAKDDLIYYGDKEKVYQYGGIWDTTHFAYRFDQLDIEAHIEVLKGQWIQIKEQN